MKLVPCALKCCSFLQQALLSKGVEKNTEKYKVICSLLPFLLLPQTASAFLPEDSAFRFSTVPACSLAAGVAGWAFLLELPAWQQPTLPDHLSLAEEKVEGSAFSCVLQRWWHCGSVLPPALRDPDATETRRLQGTCLAPCLWAGSTWRPGVLDLVGGSREPSS